MVGHTDPVPAHIVCFLVGWRCGTDRSLRVIHVDAWRAEHQVLVVAANFSVFYRFSLASSTCQTPSKAANRRLRRFFPLLPGYRLIFATLDRLNIEPRRVLSHLSDGRLRYAGLLS